MVRLELPVEAELANTKIPLPTFAIVLVPTKLMVNSALPDLLNTPMAEPLMNVPPSTLSLNSNSFLMVALCRVRTLFSAS